MRDPELMGHLESNLKKIRQKIKNYVKIQINRYFSGLLFKGNGQAYWQYKSLSVNLAWFADVG